LFPDVAAFILECPIFVQRKVIDYGKMKRYCCRNEQMNMQKINKEIKRDHINGCSSAAYNSVLEKDSVFFY